MKAGKTNVVLSPAIEARVRTGLSQSKFAMRLGVSVHTLQGWEQRRKQPSGAARTLLTIARTNPKALLAVAGKWITRAQGDGVKLLFCRNQCDSDPIFHSSSIEFSCSPLIQVMCE